MGIINNNLDSSWSTKTIESHADGPFGVYWSFFVPKLKLELKIKDIDQQSSLISKIVLYNYLHVFVTLSYDHMHVATHRAF